MHVADFSFLLHYSSDLDTYLEHFSWNAKFELRMGHNMDTSIINNGSANFL